MAWTAPRTWVTNEIPTAANFNAHVRDNTKEIWRQIVAVEFTADVTVSGSEGSPTDVVSAGALTFTAEPIIVEFVASEAVTGAANDFVAFSLWDDTTDLGRIGIVQASAGTVRQGVRADARLTPTAASHTYKIRAWRSGTNGTVKAGAGGVGAYRPGYIRILQRGG